MLYPLSYGGAPPSASAPGARQDYGTWELSPCCDHLARGGAGRNAGIVAQSAPRDRRGLAHAPSRKDRRALRHPSSSGPCPPAPRTSPVPSQRPSPWAAPRLRRPGGAPPRLAQAPPRDAAARWVAARVPGAQRHARQRSGHALSAHHRGHPRPAGRRFGPGARPHAAEVDDRRRSGRTGPSGPRRLRQRSVHRRSGVDRFHHRSVGSIRTRSSHPAGPALGRERRVRPDDPRGVGAVGRDRRLPERCPPHRSVRSHHGVGDDRPASRQRPRSRCPGTSCSPSSAPRAPASRPCSRRSPVSRRRKGQVLFDGLDVYENYPVMRNKIGVVPQNDVVHAALTVRQTLEYAAELRERIDQVSRTSTSLTTSTSASRSCRAASAGAPPPPSSS